MFYTRYYVPFAERRLQSRMSAALSRGFQMGQLCSRIANGSHNEQEYNQCRLLRDELHYNYTLKIIFKT